MPARRDLTLRSAAAWLALLLLFVQLQALLHPIAHLGERVPQESTAGLSTSHDADACVVCALLASGADSPTRSSRNPPLPSGVIASPAPAVELQASAAPAWYESRAPPVLP